MELTKAEITINEGDYNSAQKTLIEIWNSHCKSVEVSGMDIGVMFTQPIKKHRTDNVRICGLPGKLVAHVNNKELIKMDTNKFILLMAKAGIKVEIKTEIKAANQL